MGLANSERRHEELSRFCGFDRPGESIPEKGCCGDIDRRFDNLSGSGHQSHKELCKR